MNLADRSDRLIRAMGYSFHSLEQKYHVEQRGYTYGKSTQFGKRERYGYIPLSWNQFLDLPSLVYKDLQTAGRDYSNSHTFVEFGSGIGLKTMVGSNLFGSAIGFEFKNEYLKIANDLYGTGANLYSIGANKVVFRKKRYS